MEEKDIIYGVLHLHQASSDSFLSNYKCAYVVYIIHWEDFYDIICEFQNLRSNWESNKKWLIIKTFLPEQLGNKPNIVQPVIMNDKHAYAS
jgi:hypothetical protein